jgi:hypothetical protein
LKPRGVKSGDEVVQGTFLAEGAVGDKRGRVELEELDGEGVKKGQVEVGTEVIGGVQGTLLNAGLPSQPCGKQ